MEEVRSGGKLGVTFSILVAILESGIGCLSPLLLEAHNMARPYFLKVCNLGFLWFEPYSPLVFCIAIEVLRPARQEVRTMDFT